MPPEGKGERKGRRSKRKREKGKGKRERMAKPKRLWKGSTFPISMLQLGKERTSGCRLPRWQSPGGRGVRVRNTDRRSSSRARRRRSDLGIVLGKSGRKPKKRFKNIQGWQSPSAHLMVEPRPKKEKKQQTIIRGGLKRCQKEKF